MSDQWAARRGDDLIHTSVLGDITSVLLETASYAALGLAVGAAAVFAAPLLGGAATVAGATAAAIGSSCVLNGIVVGVIANASGLGDWIGEKSEALSSLIFPPTPQGKIASGSDNVHTNGLPAARAAGALVSPDAAPPAPQHADDFADFGNGLLNAAKQFFGALWQPTVGGPSSPVAEMNEDTIECKKHSDPQFLAQGSSSVFINGQPAVRSNDKTTCDAKVSTKASPDVRIGGDTVTVREIKSGKTPGIALALLALGLIRGRSPTQVLKNMPCMLVSSVVGMATDALISAAFSSHHPVHAATGIKVLNGDEDRDFTLPGRFPLVWRRNYCSRADRPGLFGTGWSSQFDMQVRIEDGQCLLNDPFGRELRFPLPKVGEITFSAGEGLTFRQGEQGQLLVADADGSVWRLFIPTRSDPSLLRLAMLSDEYGNGLTLEYSADGLLLGIHDEPRAVDVVLHYDDVRFPGQVTAVRQRAGEETVNLVDYAYDDRGLLHRVTDATGVIARAFTYNPQRLMASHSLPGGFTSEYRWAMFDDWRVVANRTSDGDARAMDYDLDAGLTTVTEADGAVHYHYWNQQQLVTRYVDERGENWTFEWDDNEQLIATSNPLGETTRYRYDDSGNLIEEQDPLGHTRKTQWLEDCALPVSITEANGGTTRFYYDPHHGLAQQVDALGQSTRVVRDIHGQVVEEIDAHGGSKHYHYNDAGQPLRARDCSGKLTTYDYDARGRLVTQTDANGDQTHYRYDNAGRVTDILRPESWHETLRWNDLGQLAEHTGADGKITRWRYDDAGRLTGTQSPQQGEILRQYDARGRLLSLQNQNGERYGFTWGADNLLLAQTGLDGVVTRYRYDAAGRPVARTFAAETEHALTHHYRFDAAGRLSAKRTPDGETRYAYNKMGQAVSIALHPPLDDTTHTAAPAQRIEFAYDILGRLLSEEGENGRLEYAYDALGNRTAATLPDGRQLRSLYYGSGHLLGIALDSLTITEFSRDNLHRELTRTQGRLNARVAYDPLGRLVQRQVFTDDGQRPATRFSSRRWQYDHRNNLTREEHDDNPFAWHRWQYDADGRLLKQDGSLPGNEQYRYDPAANLLDDGQSQVTHNRLTRYNGLRYRYDIFGRTTEKTRPDGTRYLYRYDAEHRMIEADCLPPGRTKAGTRVTFSYDPLGRRLSKTAVPLSRNGAAYDVARLSNIGSADLDVAQSDTRNAYHEVSSSDIRNAYRVAVTGKPETTRFLWEGFRLLQETRDDGTPLLYVYADQGSYAPLARIDGVTQPEVFYFHNRPNGLPEQLTDAEGRLRWQGTNSAWGKLTFESQHQDLPYSQNLRMQGQYLDRETGLHYNLFRYYDPDVGRFTQQDPIGLAGGLNLYQYAPNALGWVDPWGLSCKNQWNDFQRRSKMHFGMDSKRAAKAYHLWKSQNWAELEKFMGPGAWPPNDGFVHILPTTLEPGVKIDRFGGYFIDGKFVDTGTFASPMGSSFEGRALPLSSLDKPRNFYEVIQPIEADAGPAIPWFGQEGNGTQYKFSQEINDLVSSDSIKKI